MKNIFKILIPIIALMLLVSCVGDNSAPQNSDEITVFSPGKTVVILVEESMVSDAAVIKLRDAIAFLGIVTTITSDKTADFTISVGNTGVDSAKAAVSYLYANSAAADGNIAFVYKMTDGKLAIYGKDEDSVVDAIDRFISDYLSGNTLKLKSDFVFLDEYEGGSKTDAAWETRFDALEQKHGKDIADAIKRLYQFYGTDTYMWIANLYDPENGGFYYANSSRDYEGFLPDIESTTQALWFITDTGLISGRGGLTKALPEEVVSDTLAFAYSLFDESDGYFYHPQWGKNINSSRKGRDLNSSISVIQKLGGKVPDNTALDRLGNASASAAIAKFMRSEVAFADYLDSEAELLAWLNGLGINKDSHSAGHTIESVTSQIKAKGYAKAVIDWLDSKQLDNGLWQEITEQNQYTALSGLLKIGSTYNKLGGYMKKCNDMIDTAINVILSSADPYIVIYVYNPWGGLEYALESMTKANDAGSGNYDIASAYERIYAAYPDMIDATISKLAKFQKSDGSFSYYQNASAAYTQNTFVSLGYDEGDVNGTSLGLTTVRKTVFGLLDISPIPMYNSDHYEEFCSILNSILPVEKIQRPIIDANFENGEIPTSITQYATSGGEFTEIVDIKDKDGNDNKAMKVTSPSGIGNRYTFNPELASEGVNVFSFDFDIMVNSGNSYSHQVSMSNATGSIAYMFTIHVSGDTVTFKDTTSNAHQAMAHDWGIAAKVGEWIHIRLEYHVLSDTSVRIYAFINDKAAGYSENFYGKYNNSGAVNANATPKLAVDILQIYSMMGSNGEFYLDNLEADFYNAEN